MSTKTKQTTDVAALEAKLDQLKAEHETLIVAERAARRAWEAASKEAGDLGKSIEEVRSQLAKAKVPFVKGDIVIDDQGVRYRVHAVFMEARYLSRTGNERAEAGSVWGIRLTKTGTEAHAKPREIVSSRPLRKYEGIS